MSPDSAQPTDDRVSAEPDQQASEPGAGPGAAGGEPTEDELRAAYEAELSRLTTTDMMAQAVVSLLNLGARRLAPSAEDQDPSHPAARDLEQARDAIDAVRALLEILERRIPRELAPLRDALSRLQIAYAREVGPDSPATQPGPSGDGAPGASGPAGEGHPPAAGEQPAGPGPAESSGRLWVPGR